jgi:quinol monooxygenase YgiN
VFVVVAKYTVKSGQEAAVERILRELTPLSRAEPGCRTYQAQRSLDEPGVFLLYETYDDRAAYQAHTETEHFRRLVLEGAVPLLERRERSFYETLG